MGSGCHKGDKEKPIVATKAKLVAAGVRSHVLQAAPKPSAQPDVGNRVTIHYTCWISDENGLVDRQVQSSYGHQPLSFRVGVKEVIAGLDQGIRLMSIGEKRRFIIPPALAYGATGFGTIIPPAATLVFEVELLSIV